MATTADLTGDEREQRTAELMQEADANSSAVATQTALPATEVGHSALAETAVEETVATPVTPTNGTHATVTNGASAATAIARVAAPARPSPIVEEDPAAAAAAQMTRRELLTYAWGATMLLLGAESGLASFQFLYPRFRAGEFGGNFFQKPSEFGDKTTPPKGNVNGKFWMVTTAEGEKKALYMVCVHLGCLYKWVDSNFRFECPCHGSKYTHDGWYIEGPAARSLDTFAISEANGEVTVNTGKKITGTPASESPFRTVKA
jgi:cytochrome b6-f complex iron-sulfur subunit